MPQGGRLMIITHNVYFDETTRRQFGLNKPGPYVRLVVRDTGIGMDAETLRHACEPFFTTKPKGQGTGLGLASVADIVAESHGAITISSKPGRGTSVLMYLPLVHVAGLGKDGVGTGDGVGGEKSGVVTRKESDAPRLLYEACRSQLIGYWKRILAGRNEDSRATPAGR
jgi:hypothetical protein